METTSEAETLLLELASRFERELRKAGIIRGNICDDLVHAANDLKMPRSFVTGHREDVFRVLSAFCNERIIFKSRTEVFMSSNNTESVTSVEQISRQDIPSADNTDFKVSDLFVKCHEKRRKKAYDR